MESSGGSEDELEDEDEEDDGKEEIGDVQNKKQLVRRLIRERSDAYMDMVFEKDRRVGIAFKWLDMSQMKGEIR
jgi:hypothetical protein